MDTSKFKALKEAVRNAHKELKPFRDELEQAVRAYVGPHYGNNGGSSRPVNMLELAVESLLQQLSSRAPQVLCRTHVADLRSQATEIELALNQAIKTINFQREHRQWVLSAIFCVGVLELGLSTVNRAEIDGQQIPLTELFCECIAFDDFVYDTRATKWKKDRVTFWGHRHTMDLETARNNPEFDAEARKTLKPLERKQGSGSISTGEKRQDGFAEVCELWQIFVPAFGQVVTMTDDSDIPLRIVDWEGPEGGPYHLLGLNDVPNNIMPLSPVANWIDLDELENLLWRKLGNQASRQKTIGVCDNANITDGQQIIKTGDGDVIAVGNPNSFKEARFGGVDQQTLGFAINVKQTADFVMGNLSAQLGLGTTAETLGQEQIIANAANARIASMQGTILTATEQVLRDIAFYLNTHPTMNFDITQRIPGVDMEIDLQWPFRDDGFGQEQDVRRGTPVDYDISIVPYSMTASTPQQRAMMLRQLWAQDILPSVQMGLVPNIPKYFDALATLLDLPELRDIVTESQPEMDPLQQASRQMASTAGKPNGQYTRSNVSRGQTPQAAEQQMMQTLMAAPAAE